MTVTVTVTVTTCFEEIIHSEKEMICSSCKQILTPVSGKEHLLKCDNCSKFTLFKSNNIHTNVVIQVDTFHSSVQRKKKYLNKNVFYFKIDNKKTTFYTTQDILQQFFQQQNPQLPMTSENLSEYYLINGPWLTTISHFRRELISINNI